VDKVALGQVFHEYLGSPYQSLFHQMLHTHVSSGAGIIGQLARDVQSTPRIGTKLIYVCRNHRSVVVAGGVSVQFQPREI
jgi:arginine decarboxylase-like protein